jgi:hypothetical protein
MPFDATDMSFGREGARDWLWGAANNKRTNEDIEARLVECDALGGSDSDYAKELKAELAHRKHEGDDH